MTRWARAGNSQKHRKMPEDATSWEELSKCLKNSTKFKEKQINSMVDKSPETVIIDKKDFNSKIKNAKNCKIEEKILSKRKLKKLKWEEKKKLKTASNPDLEYTPDPDNISETVSITNCAEENKDYTETLQIETTEPMDDKCTIGEKILSKKQLKKLKREKKKLKTASNPNLEYTSDPDNISETVSITNCAEENKDYTETLQIETTEPMDDKCTIGEKTLSKKQLKKLKREEKKLKTACNPSLENTSDPDNISKNVLTTNCTEENKEGTETSQIETIEPKVTKCATGEKTLSKRQLKKLKRKEKKKLKRTSNPNLEFTSDPDNISENVSTINCAEENEDCTETLQIETIEPMDTNALLKLKRLKTDKSNLMELSNKSPNKSEEKSLQGSDQKEINSSLNEKKLKKKELFLRKLQERRAENGITLLSPAAENRLYRIKKSLRKKGYTPEMIKDIIRKERRKAELEFRRTTLTQTCFNCGQPGHFRVDCNVTSNKNSQETPSCLKYGSAGHNSIECTEKVSGHTFLTCFVCKGQGHISRDCPGKKQAVKEEEPLVALHIIKEGESIDDEVIDIKKINQKSKFIKPKIVKF